MPPPSARLNTGRQGPPSARGSRNLPKDADRTRTDQPPPADIMPPPMPMRPPSGRPPLGSPVAGIGAGPGDTIPMRRDDIPAPGQTVAVPLPPLIPPPGQTVAVPLPPLMPPGGETVAVPVPPPMPGPTGRLDDAARPGHTIAVNPNLTMPVQKPPQAPMGGEPGSGGFRKIGRFTKVGPPPVCTLCHEIKVNGLSRCRKCGRLVCPEHLTPVCCDEPEAKKPDRELLRGPIRIELMPGSQERLMVLPGPRVHFGRNRLREPRRNLPNDMVLRVLPCRSAKQDADNWRTTNRISSKHGAFMFGPREAYIVDHSKLGILLNGKRIPRDQDVPLPVHFELEIGAGALTLCGDQIQGRYDKFGVRLEAISLRRKRNFIKHFYVLMERSFGITMEPGHMEVVSPNDPAATVVLSRDPENEGAYSLRSNVAGLYLDNESFAVGETTLLGPHHMVVFGNGALEFNAGKIEDFTRF